MVSAGAHWSPAIGFGYPGSTAKCCYGFERPPVAKEGDVPFKNLFGLIGITAAPNFDIGWRTRCPTWRRASRAWRQPHCVRRSSSLIARRPARRSPCR
jgi:hypothetical protein